MVATQDGPRTISVALTAEHLAWLDSKRLHGNISRSAALRQALDTLIAMGSAAHPQQPEHG
jgi:hypothetical protein